MAKMPTRKTKCPHCGQFMFVKASPGDPVKRLVTEEQAARIEQEWSARHEATKQANMAVAREAQLRSRENMVKSAKLIHSISET